MKRFLKFIPILLILCFSTVFAENYVHYEWTCVQKDGSNVAQSDTITENKTYTTAKFYSNGGNGLPTNCIGTQTKTTYTVTLNGNGGTVSGGLSYQSDGSFKLPTNVTKTGYTFTGWTGSNGTTAQTDATVSAITTGNLTYTANWSANKYALTINPNGGSYNSTTSNTTVEQGYNTTYDVVVPTKTGYTFNGWTLSGGGSYSNSKYTFGTSDGTLTAKWTANKSDTGATFTKKFQYNGDWVYVEGFNRTYTGEDQVVFTVKCAEKDNDGNDANASGCNFKYALSLSNSTSADVKWSTKNLSRGETAELKATAGGKYYLHLMNNNYKDHNVFNEDGHSYAEVTNNSTGTEKRTENGYDYEKWQYNASVIEVGRNTSELTYTNEYKTLFNVGCKDINGCTITYALSTSDDPTAVVNWTTRTFADDGGLDLTASDAGTYYLHLKKEDNGTHNVYGYNSQTGKSDKGVTIGVATPSADVIANNLVYSGSAQQLVKISNKTPGNLKTNFKVITEDKKETKITADIYNTIDATEVTGAQNLKATNAGTYYVYYCLNSNNVSNYGKAYGKVKVTIAQAESSITVSGKENLTYNGSAQQLVTVSNKNPNNLTTEFKVTTEDKGEGNETTYNETLKDVTSVIGVQNVKATNAGTYYVYYCFNHGADTNYKNVYGKKVVTIK